jgi:hypothetical protein
MLLYSPALLGKLVLVLRGIRSIHFSVRFLLGGDAPPSRPPGTSGETTGSARSIGGWVSERANNATHSPAGVGPLRRIFALSSAHHHAWRRPLTATTAKKRRLPSPAALGRETVVKPLSVAAILVVEHGRRSDARLARAGVDTKITFPSRRNRPRPSAVGADARRREFLVVEPSPRREPSSLSSRIGSTLEIRRRF